MIVFTGFSCGGSDHHSSPENILSIVEYEPVGVLVTESSDQINVKIKFSDAVVFPNGYDVLTITANDSSIELELGFASYNETTHQLSFSIDRDELIEGLVYTCTIQTESFTDASGNALTENFQWTFSLGFVVEDGDIIKNVWSNDMFFIYDGMKYRIAGDDEDLKYALFTSWGWAIEDVYSVADEVLDSFVDAYDVTIRPGTFLVQYSGDIYAIDHENVLIQMDSPSVLASIYGVNWSSNLVELDSDQFANYLIDTTDTVGSVSDMPANVLLKSGVNLYLTTGDGEITSVVGDGIDDNRFKALFVTDMPQGFVYDINGGVIDVYQLELDFPFP